jgi:hypothetical protein
MLKMGFWAFAVIKLKNIFEDYEMKNLVEQAFSSKPTTRVLARARLKKDFPDVYEQVMELKQ